MASKVYDSAKRDTMVVDGYEEELRWPKNVRNTLDDLIADVLRQRESMPDDQKAYLEGLKSDLAKGLRLS